MSEVKQHDVGILGWWYGKNYGSILTYYALNRAVTDLGYSVLMVHEALGYNGWRVKWPDDIISVQFAKRLGFDLTEQVHFNELPQLNARVGTFLVGSDQLWNPKIGRVNDDLFLDFVSDENRRVAYGTSFGNRQTKKFMPDFIEQRSENLRRFDAISVRERYAVDIARHVFGVNATSVVDPVFLLDRQQFESLADSATWTPPSEYLAAFFLDIDENKVRVAASIADKLGLERILVIPNPDGGREDALALCGDDRFTVLPTDSPENFLAGYRGADYVVTDSFHGTALAIIFERPFSSIYNERRGADRFKDLMSMIDLDDARRVFESDTPEAIASNGNVVAALDFEPISKSLEFHRNESMDWLQRALAGEFSGTVIADGVGAVSGRLPRRVVCPTFETRGDGWKIEDDGESTSVRVSDGAQALGNRVWCDLPAAIEKHSAYRLTIDWTVETTAPGLNVHLRDPENGTFYVIGRFPGSRESGGGQRRVDTVDFLARSRDHSQLMLGAVHFTGDDAGARIWSVTVQEIAVEAMRTVNQRLSYEDRVAVLALRDSDRFVRVTSPKAASNTTVGARARIMFHAHAIEKGLSRSDFRAGFGKVAVPGLAKEMNRWVKEGNDQSDPLFVSGASVMRAYLDRHRSMQHDVSHYWELFDPGVQQLVESAPSGIGGVREAESTREPRPIGLPEKSFLDVVYGRRSVREFSPKRVDDALVASAVQIAMQAPSVCNRQGARVHQFDDPEVMNAALRIQGGFGGYPTPPKLLLVTADLTSFLFSEERNQPFIDGGLFLMTLLLGLQQVGLGCCSLNTAMGVARERSLRELLDIPDNEVFISFIAVGHYDPEITTPRSKRINVDEVLTYHGGGERQVRTDLAQTAAAAHAVRRSVGRRLRSSRRKLRNTWYRARGSLV